MSLIEAQQQVEEMTRMSMRPSTSSSSTMTIDITENSNSNNGIQVIEEVKEESIKEKFSEIFDSKYSRQALVIGVGLVVFQQFSGQPSVLYFANRIFEKAGLGYEAALGVGVFKLVMTIISAGLVENPKFGRRPLLLYGNIGVTASLAALSLLYSVPFLPPDLNQIAIIISILFFVGSYQIGFGPISWLILSEIFPLRIRSTAVSIGTLFNFGSNLLVATLFELERVSLGEGVLFGQFALIALMATLFTYKYVFETRGLSLEEIELKLKEIVDGENKE
jgi:MFS transporter, SP family, galactose:H+ symporter